ncbi:MAG: adenosine monophosphate-protein transferase [Spirochaetes bacterium GWD1_61_31]|nr:MAG: adenosine monophosphate-protein transferase [Spirochaetes bacterium GWB1_60_80]OHD31842.1 MAG: adenosine monophosphate-protein transferase [Spirochaetes bacterium GWC1_61_12]OHD40062.1 MAG: adenosine monophosphate-protein transferase [Spirochaetes bacterium GWD1_61_31]OHD45889.1 MAG: adenosine monophosphate-protein transferase [Spirochaetes bacterium GWE1_60_18]OHD58433.1 MAG: adenosine monophosphate-protein transferase [Spirochaetes bacterium GWF1_60_12]HAW85415.1 adenosine monophosph
MNLELVPLHWTKDANIIIGQSHFIKTVEDIAEIIANSVPGATYGLAFNEASGPCLVRTAGNDDGLIKDASDCALASGAGHCFFLVLGDGLYPINLLDRIKACPEVCHIFCATANPLQLIVASSEQGAGILGVIDGGSPKGIETEADRAWRLSFLRKIGYKFG